MSLRHAILGFLSLCPMSGYDLRKHMDESTGHFWPADQAQIYRTLAQLVSDGLVDVQDIAQAGKPDRREHRINQRGLSDLDSWLSSPITYAPAREVFLLRLFFVGRLGAAQTVAVLNERALAAQELFATLSALRDSLQPRLPERPDITLRLRLATLDNGMVHAKAELEWLQRLAAELENDQ
jgi:PadR family transcriptional regulator, regulatory protein AphA